MRVSAPTPYTPTLYTPTKNIYKFNRASAPNLLPYSVKTPMVQSFGQIYFGKKSKKDTADAEEPAKNKKKPHFKIKHSIRTALLFAAALSIAATLRSCAPAPKVYPIEQVRKNAEETLLNFKFEKADLVYDINNILNGKKLSDDSLDLYRSNVENPNSKVYMSENAGQMMNVLAIASISEGAKGQVQAEELTPYLLRALQYDRTGLLDGTGDAVTGEGEPWYYVAAAIVSKEYPELIEYMSEDEKKAMQDKGFLEGFWDDIKFTVGSGEEYEHRLGDTLKRRDTDYATYILTNDINPWSQPSDNPWFGPAAVGYAIRGKLDNISGMSFDEAERLRMGFVNNDSDKQRFMYDEDYRNKVTSSYILKYMKEAVLQNTGKIASGLSALGLQQAGFMNKELSTELLRQVAEEASRIRLFNNEVNKLDIAIKAYVLAQEGRYIELSADTRKEIRTFQINNPTSTAASVFMLAEETYLRDLKELVENHEMFQSELASELEEPDEEKDLEYIKDTAYMLMGLSGTISPIVEKEKQVAAETNDAASFESWKKIQENLVQQDAQLFAIITGIDGEKTPEN